MSARATATELKRRARRKASYHLDASRNRLPTDPDEEEEDTLFRYLLSPQQPQPPRRRGSPTIDRPSPQQIEKQQAVLQAKTELLRCLARSGGDVTAPHCEAAVEAMAQLFDASRFDASKGPVPPPPPPPATSSPSRRSPFAAPPLPPVQIEGMWIDISKPKFTNCLGQTTTNNNGGVGGDYLYSLGRMSFGKFAPTDLVCSLQGAFNPVHVVDDEEAGHHHAHHVPPMLRQELKRRREENPSIVLRTYDVVAAFTIEAGAAVQGQLKQNPDNPNPNAAVRRPIEGLMTTYGYELHDPSGPSNRLSIWFVGGTLEYVDEANAKEWRRVFGSSTGSSSSKSKSRHQKPSSSSSSSAPNRLDDDGRISYSLPQPVSDGAYLDVLYLDETLKIVRSNAGMVYVFARVPYFPDE